MSTRLTVLFEVKEDESGAFEQLAALATARVKAEDKGCEAYDLYRSVDDDSRYVLVEAWTTAQNLEAHGSSPAVAEMRKTRPLLASDPQLYRYED